MAVSLAAFRIVQCARDSVHGTTVVTACRHNACSFGAPQGINRLGKAAPRPGSLRPPDPTRNRITDHFSENVEGLESDRDYQRAVQDVSSILIHIDPGLFGSVLM